MGPSAGETESTLQTMLQRCAEAIVRHLDGAFARLWTLNDRQNALELQASAGLETRLNGGQIRVPAWQTSDWPDRAGGKVLT